ncbi:TonB-dependent receptor domain-containing protein [Salegentibacter chungangensis]|uniref:TonB-dependent receptor domain-containing protein n=1 Tax=Salegentibacter chungangensis TaxID=1335724 RepID=A0ABW3NV87_9FLAO
MKFVSIRRSLFLSMFFIGGALFAQDPLGSETVTVVKPYTPSVGDANKIKQSPVMADSVETAKKPVKYSIFSVPVASTFTPAKGRATTVERERPPKLYNNYATLGFGNYTRALAEFYSNLEVNRTDNFGIFLTHNSSQGGIDGVRLDDKYYDTELNLNYNSQNRDLSWKTEIGAEHQLFNWYGLPESPQLEDETVFEIDPQQNYISAYLGGEIELYDSFFDRATARFRHSRDSYSSAENHFTTNGSFEVNIANELITTEVEADILNGKFEEGYPTGSGYDYTYMNFGISPSLLILRDDLSLNLGVAFFYGLDVENTDNNFYIYPKITASYRLAGDYFTAYAGVEGDLEQNSYYSFYKKNPYVSPTLTVMPTDTEYDAYIGGKGKLSNAVSYNLRAKYVSSFNQPLYKRNEFAPEINDEDYAYGNSFGVVYDDMQTLSFYGELNIDVNRDFRLGVNAEYFDYSNDNEAYAWNLPDIKASLNADYQITEKWFTGANIFYVGERKDEAEVLTGDPLIQTTPEIITLDSYFDVNANLGYRFNDQLSIFAKGNNLLNNDYQKWTNFQVQGIQVLAGLTYKFDFD